MKLCLFVNKKYYQLWLCLMDCAVSVRRKLELVNKTKKNSNLSHWRTLLNRHIWINFLVFIVFIDSDVFVDSQLLLHRLSDRQHDSNS
jgi:hypothetical protein